MSRGKGHGFLSPPVLELHELGRHVHEPRSQKLADALAEAVQDVAAAHAVLQETLDDEMHRPQVGELAPFHGVPVVPVVA